jgi:hypothetical protein
MISRCENGLKTTGRFTGVAPVLRNDRCSSRSRCSSQQNWLRLPAPLQRFEAGASLRDRISRVEQSRLGHASRLSRIPMHVTMLDPANYLTSSPNRYWLADVLLKTTPAQPTDSRPPPDPSDFGGWCSPLGVAEFVTEPPLTGKRLLEYCWLSLLSIKNCKIQNLQCDHESRQRQ